MYYVCSFYEQRWYNGKIMEETEQDKFKFQFLQQDLNVFRWPKIADIAVVHRKYIFYGPVNLIENGPFQINRHDNLRICKFLKKTFKTNNVSSLHYCFQWYRVVFKKYMFVCCVCVDLFYKQTKITDFESFVLS